MKKIVLNIVILLMFPISVFAYSDKVLLGGENIGIKINTSGVTVVGFYEVNGKYIAKDTLKIGDNIISINNVEVNSINDLNNCLDESDLTKVDVKLIRNNKIIDTYLNIVYYDGSYKTGLYIKDNISGIGTLTYVDPVSKIYGALGHEIAFNETNTRVEVRDGNILYSMIRGIDKSYDGYVGSKNASIDYNNKIGSIVKNCEYGIYGFAYDNIGSDIVNISTFDAIHEGPAYIYTDVTGNVEKYSINITGKYNNKKKTTKAISFEITDERLLNVAGGIVQGMSGSPILQDGNLIGAVTHVVIEDVNKGYAIAIETMLESGDTIKK